MTDNQSPSKDGSDNKHLKPYSFRFADGMVKDSQSVNLEFDHNGAQDFATDPPRL